MTRHDILRAASFAAALAAMLTAASCASSDDGGRLSADPDHNHPITVAPSYKVLALSFGTPGGGLLPQDEVRFDAFVHAYLARGTGSVSISVPRGPGSSDAIHYFGERLVAMGVPRFSILVGTHEIVDGDPRVKLGFITYHASTAPCGGWSDATSSSENSPMANFGCASQHNLAAMVADPRDLVAPRGFGPTDAVRRSAVMDNYEAGKPTAAQKTADQQANVSSVQ